MTKPPSRPLPPDQPQREQALDPSRSVLVQAPAGSGKTDLLTRRFLRLLAEVDDPAQIVAITFTRAAAAEMRHRILSELEKSAATDAPPPPAGDEFSMAALAHRALHRSRRLGWQLLELPAQLRISTIDSFCRELALQQPLLSAFGSDLLISDQPAELYRRAARRTLQNLGAGDAALSAAIEALLLWRDNSWQEMEDQLVQMLAQRDRWMHGFVLDRNPLTQSALRQRLEEPFARAVRESLSVVSGLFDRVPGALDEALALAKFACEEPGANSPWEIAECAEIPSAPFPGGLESAREFFSLLSTFLQTQKGVWRTEKGLKATDGFPPSPRGRAGKARFSALVALLGSVPDFAASLAAVRDLPPARYTDEDWAIVQACFTVLRHAAGELWAVFAEAGTVDFTQVAQIARRVLCDEEGHPTDAAMAVADSIHHLLVDEFQDTSRRQHELLASLVAAWPDSSGRTVFVVGDPMQSIYFFRDADAELFPRVQKAGIEIPDGPPLLFQFVPLSANFRTQPALVRELNESFARVFAKNDGSGVSFSPAEPAREGDAGTDPRLTLHLDFVPQTSRAKSATSSNARQKEEIAQKREAARGAQTAAIVALIQSHMHRVEHARELGGKYRIAVLGRTRSALAPIAAALRQAAVPFRAVELEQLRDRPEVLDALALARALLNPQDRIAWLGVLRAPWCGLALSDLHALTSADEASVLSQPIPQLLTERLSSLSPEGRGCATRTLAAMQSAPDLRTAHATISLGAWLQQVWLSLGGASCVDAAAHANLDLLWRCLDALPAGEQDLLGASLDTALEKLTALPDPTAGSECGVQLMTIHKSKGLEFEIVIVPELQAGSASTRGKLLSWLERGVAEPGDSDQLTEFLVAPLQTKGADRGKAKEWVDRVYSKRESQETRRILYVAATRAREELHLFARPGYKVENGSLTLAEPRASLLATAWPALEEDVRACFDQWASARAVSLPAEEQVVPAIAAEGAGNIIAMQALARPTVLRRLPADFQVVPIGLVPGAPAQQSPVGISNSQLYERHEGGVSSRAFGNAVHALLQELARLRATQDWSATRASLALQGPRIAAQVRAAGLHASQAQSIAARAIDLALKATHDPHGQWILSPHPNAASEAAWAGVIAGKLRTVRVDRIFRAGCDPLSKGEDAWWIIDYKTAHEDGLDPSEALPRLRSRFAPQLEAYAAVLHNLHGAQAVLRAALYYPRMSLLDWWEVKP